MAIQSCRERGFRRLTLGVSLLALCAGLALTVQQFYQTRLFLANRVEWKQCFDAFAPPPSPSLGHQIEAIKRCGEYTEEVPLPAVPYAGMRVAANTLKVFPALDPIILSHIADRFTGFALALSLTLTGFLVALLWAVFYFARWVARGFDAQA